MCVVEDVLKARLKTLGVVEHQFTISMGTMRGASNWVIYDVGGARNQRHAWAPYFQDGKPRLVLHQFFFSISSIRSERHNFPGAYLGI
jgi:hypothetical protein